VQENVTSPRGFVLEATSEYALISRWRFEYTFIHTSSTVTRKVNSTSYLKYASKVRVTDNAQMANVINQKRDCIHARVKTLTKHVFREKISNNIIG